MLNKPHLGSVDITIDNFSDRASYLTDVPFDLLNAFIRFYRDGNPQTVYFDAEGWDYYIIIAWDMVFIITSKGNGGYMLHEIVVKTDDMVRELIKDLEDNLDDWKNWDGSGKDGDSQHYDTADKRESLLAELKSLIRIT